MNSVCIAIILVLAFIALDVLFGVVNAALKHELDSGKMREGLTHKMGELLFLILGILFNYASDTLHIAENIPFIQGFAVPLIVMELFSLLEIVKSMNPDLASMPIFKYLKDK